ncbi:MAG TPA: TIGR03905 family TSCPD domain-containing protein [Oscillospiraceae bacterium]|nr:TIGR03905 family TSCPD domain-containing protein [Oscillospiraceae bacterium]HPS33886.1 TIGR03905 family TSCPD domain-containing protein [Oscillospiraceae bacterium]
MSKHTYNTEGTCSHKIEFVLTPDNKVENIQFIGGCDGNLKGLCMLCDGMKADELIQKLSGIRCGRKSTSCPDQLSRALKKALSKL